MAKPDGGTAFPREQGTGDYYVRESGMSLRDYFAGQALAGLLAKNTEGRLSKAEGVQRAATWSYEYADAMLAEREKD